MISRLHLVLLAVLVASALLLVRTAYEGRRLFSANQRAEADAVRIAQEYKQLDAQRQNNATNQRIVAEAEGKLQMRKAAQRFDVVEATASGAAR